MARSMKDMPLTACEALRFELISSEEAIEDIYWRLWKLYAYYKHEDRNGVWYIDPYLSRSFVKLCTGFNYDEKLLDKIVIGKGVRITTLRYEGTEFGGEVWPTWHRVFRCAPFGLHKPRAMELAAFEEIKDKKRLDR